MTVVMSKETMRAKRVEDGVLRTTARYSSIAPFSYVSVRFRSKQRINECIHFLEQLRDGQRDHFHILDDKFGKGCPPELAEVVFLPPPRKKKD
jgi:hypothetical protein